MGLIIITKIKNKNKNKAKIQTELERKNPRNQKQKTSPITIKQNMDNKDNKELCNSFKQNIIKYLQSTHAIHSNS